MWWTTNRDKTQNVDWKQIGMKKKKRQRSNCEGKQIHVDSQLSKTQIVTKHKMWQTSDCHKAWRALGLRQV